MLTNKTMRLKLFISASLLLLSMVAMSQSPPPATPIDGGLGLLLAGGAAFGIKKLLRKK